MNESSNMGAEFEKITYKIIREYFKKDFNPQVELVGKRKKSVSFFIAYKLNRWYCFVEVCWPRTQCFVDRYSYVLRL